MALLTIELWKLIGYEMSSVGDKWNQRVMYVLWIWTEHKIGDSLLSIVW